MTAAMLLWTQGAYARPAVAPFPSHAAVHAAASEPIVLDGAFNGISTIASTPCSEGHPRVTSIGTGTSGIFQGATFTTDGCISFGSPTTASGTFTTTTPTDKYGTSRIVGSFIGTLTGSHTSSTYTIDPSGSTERWTGATGTFTTEANGTPTADPNQTAFDGTLVGTITPVTTTFTGSARYQDDAGLPRAAREVDVQLLTTTGSSTQGPCIPTAGQELIEDQGQTLRDGSYKIDIPSARTSAKFFVRILAQKTTTANVEPQHKVTATNFGPDPWCVQSASAAAGTAISAVQLLQVTDTNRAFALLDALLAGRDYLDHLSTSEIPLPPPPLVAVDFPAQTTSMGVVRDGKVSGHVKRVDAFYWDTILHEYGHVLGDLFDINPVPPFGADHFLNENLSVESATPGGPIYGKQIGTAGAWQEGLADFFSVMAQQYVYGPANATLKTPLVPKAGGTVISDSGGFEYDLNANGAGKSSPNAPIKYPSLGEDNEVSVSRILWHFHHDVGLAVSEINMLGALNAAHARTLSSAVTAILESSAATPGNEAQEARAVKFGSVLSDHRVASEISGDLPTLTKTSSPKLDWYANGQASGNFNMIFHLNHAAIEFWNSAFTKRVACRESPSAPGGLPPRPGCTTGSDLAETSGAPFGGSWEPMPATWTPIATALCLGVTAGATITVRVVLMNSNRSAPITGPYISQPVGLSMRC